jgi:hypothetical protein
MSARGRAHFRRGTKALYEAPKLRKENENEKDNYRDRGGWRACVKQRMGRNGGRKYVDLEQMASNILAASLCKGTLFNGESVVPHLVAASIVLGRKRAEDAFFSGIRKNEISANGKEVWCAATIKAAKERNSEMLTEAGSNIKAAP